jgi:hypothetical protein
VHTALPHQADQDLLSDELRAGSACSLESKERHFKGVLPDIWSHEGGIFLGPLSQGYLPLPAPQIELGEDSGLAEVLQHLVNHG